MFSELASDFYLIKDISYTKASQTALCEALYVFLGATENSVSLSFLNIVADLTEHSCPRIKVRRMSLGKCLLRRLWLLRLR